MFQYVRHCYKNSDQRKPLILSGARQVGKTYILELFGKEHFENVIYLNMEIEGTLRNFIDNELMSLWKNINKNTLSVFQKRILDWKTI